MKTFTKNSIVAAMAISFVLGLTGPLAALAASPAAVNLGTAGNFVILSKTGISTTGPTAITGDIGVSPAASTYITGFALTLPMASAFSTSALVTGKVYAPDYAVPTPATLTTAVLDMQTAYTDAAGRSPSVTELGAGNIGGLTLTPGVYKWGTGVTIPTNVTLSGGANDVWIFQIAQNLTVSSGAHVILSGGAQASNVYWQVAGQTTLGTTSVFNGNILDQTAIVMNTGAALSGRALAQTAVTLDSNTVTKPTAATPTPTPMPAPTSTPNPTMVTCQTTEHSCPCATGNYCLFMGAMCVSPATACPVSMPVPTPTPAPTPNPTASSNSNSTLQTQLNGLLATLHALQAQAGQQGSSASASAFASRVRAIATDLTMGSRGNNVNALQQFLISQGKGPAAQALAGNGASTYFGALTRAALAEFQKNNGITPASGYFGAKTRAYLRSSNL
jgi:Ice-binding-like/Putative peptidoglycan binding domain